MQNLSLKETLKQLQETVDWFDRQQEVDLEKGLQKVKEGAQLIKISRERFKEIENEFEDVKRELTSDTE